MISLQGRFNSEAYLSFLSDEILLKVAELEVLAVSSATFRASVYRCTEMMNCFQTIFINFRLCLNYIKPENSFSALRHTLPLSPIKNVIEPNKRTFIPLRLTQFVQESFFMCMKLCQRMRVSG